MSELAPVGSGERWRGWLLAALLAAGALVVSQARYPPVLDLAQQLDQIRLAGEVLRGERSDLEIRWLGPNRLGYLPLALAHLVAPTDWAPRVAAWLLLAVGLVAVHLLARVTRQGAATTLLGSTLVLGSSFYAGFFNFVVGWLGLAYWTWELDERRRRRAPWRVALSTSVGAFLLYLSHGLWLAMLGLVVASWVLLHRFDLRELFARVVGVSILAPLALSFRHALAASGWQASGSVIVSPLERLSDLDVAASIPYGGLKGPLEQGLFLVLLVWLTASLAELARRRSGSRSPFLLVVAGAFLLVAFAGPFRVDLTILFAWRWGAPGFLALLMALPSPALRSSVANVLAGVVFAAQLVTHGLAWHTFDRVEMDGFDRCLAGIGGGDGVLAVDGRPASDRFRLTPTLQMHAFASYERDARIAFSFVEYGSSLVVRRDAARIQLLGQVLLMNPAQIQTSHLTGFEHVLVHGPLDLAAGLERRTGLLSRTGGGEYWHLLAVGTRREDSVFPGGEGDP